MTHCTHHSKTAMSRIGTVYFWGCLVTLCCTKSGAGQSLAFIQELDKTQPTTEFLSSHSRVGSLDVQLSIHALIFIFDELLGWQHMSMILGSQSKTKRNLGRKCIQEQWQYIHVHSYVCVCVCARAWKTLNLTVLTIST